MRNKICLWSGPRNISTALMYSFSSRSDTIVFDEPLYAHYLSSSPGVNHPGVNEILDAYENNGDKVVQNIIMKKYKKPISFFKLMSHFTINLDLEFLSNVKNIFLIRDPLSVISSYNKVIKYPTIEDIGILHQYNMLNFLKKRKIPFVVIDSQDILEFPKRSLLKLCDSLSIPFEDKMLIWKKGPKKFDGVWSKYWYSRVHKTEGFIPSTYNTSGNILKGKNIQTYNKALMYYNKLKKYTFD